MTAPFRAASLKPIRVEIADEPILNVLVSMAHLVDVTTPSSQHAAGYLTDRPMEFDSWLLQAATTLGAEERSMHALVFTMFGTMLLPERSYTDFASYLDAFDATKAEQLRDRALAVTAAQAAPILHDSAHYHAHMSHLYPNDPVDPILLEQAYILLCNPEELKRRSIAYLRHLWHDLFAEEWHRRSMLMHALIAGLRSRDMPQASAPAVLQAVIGREAAPATLALLGQVEKLIIVPTPHLSLYVSRFTSADTAWAFVAFSTIMSWTLRQEPIKISEVLMRLNPLADEMGLRVLQLLAQHGELSSQELISMLNTSQSSVSRHLKALGNYVRERRGEGASKYYRLNPGFLEWTLVTLRSFMSSAAASPPLLHELSERGRGYAPSAGRPIGPAPQSERREQADASSLRRFMNREGRIHAYPTRRRDQLMVLKHLWEYFEAGRSYTEREVNDILRAQLDLNYDDFVTLRRELYDAQLLGRERDGSRYWRIEQATHEA